MSHLARTPAPPYYAVVFTSRRNTSDPEGYAAAAKILDELAVHQPGFLGIESVRAEDGLGITVSYWASLEAIDAWRNVAVHRQAQATGRTNWYDEFHLRVCHVERDRHYVRE
ncbi:MAG: antibiotic biosynthesis monooxygenase [Planctomycetes bacterium]|nr:antibiotic biosynthesis monooxygenase [Planctomycetota bacterium]